LIDFQLDFRRYLIAKNNSDSLVAKWLNLHRAVAPLMKKLANWQVSNDFFIIMVVQDSN
jgi:hypothetical protein